MQIPYFVFTSGEEGVSRLDWGVKFSSPGLSSSVDSFKRNAQVDDIYRKICGAFSCPLSLERPKDNSLGFLLLPWGEAEVLLGCIFPYTDLSGRPNISLIGAIVSSSIRSSFSSPSDFVRELNRQNPLESIAKRGWGKDGQGKRPDFLSLKNVFFDRSGGFAIPVEVSWPGKNQGFIVVNGKKSVLNRTLPSPPQVPSSSEKKNRGPWVWAAVLLLMAFAGAFYWYKQSGDVSEKVVIDSAPSPKTVPTPVTPDRPHRSEEIAYDIVADVQRARGKVQSDSFDDFVSLGYALVYDDFSGVLKGIRSTYGSSNFDAGEVTLGMEDSSGNVIALEEGAMEKYVIDALKRFVDSGNFKKAEDFDGFYVRNSPKSSYDAFKDDLEKAISRPPISQTQKENSADKRDLIENVASLLKKGSQLEKTEGSYSFWIVWSFESLQGGYRVYLQEVEREPLKLARSTLTRAYIPSRFIKIYRDNAETSLEEIFSQKKKHPYITETGELEFQFRLAAPPSGGSHQEAYLEEFAREVAEGVVQSSRVSD